MEDLHLVEKPGRSSACATPGAMHHHGTIARRGPGLPGAVFDVGDEPRAARRNIAVVDAMGWDGDWHAIVMVAAESARRNRCVCR